MSIEVRYAGGGYRLAYMAVILGAIVIAFVTHSFIPILIGFLIMIAIGLVAWINGISLDGDSGTSSLASFVVVIVIILCTLAFCGRRSDNASSTAAPAPAAQTPAAGATAPASASAVAPPPAQPATATNPAAAQNGAEQTQPPAHPAGDDVFRNMDLNRPPPSGQQAAPPAQPPSSSPPSTLASRLAESLFRLTKTSQVELRDRALAMVEQLVVQGDLLELGDVTSLDPQARPSWLFAAPPGFVRRPDGSALLLGLSADEPTLLPVEMACRVQYRGAARQLLPLDGEDLGAILRQFGMIELSEALWLRHPRRETAAALIEHMQRLLAQQGPAGDIQGLSVLDPSRPAGFYKGRWREPNGLTGSYVARRPQAYGGDIWGYVQLTGGRPDIFLDLPLRGDRFRGCDAAWRLQMAIDCARSAPQTFRMDQAESGRNFHFFAPIPNWAERRFIALGSSVSPDRSLFAYWLPNAEVESSIEFLQDYLWLTADISASAGA
ncbi:MAG: hypothetical protein JO126_04175 [Alphaproteobacteria bacterium]|nr:hypothetical protein [Alphaproteobacteria bacterium]